MSMRLIKDQITVFSAENGATANSAVIDVRDFRNTMITVEALSSYDGTLKFFASYSTSGKPDITAAASITNEYFPVEVKQRNNDGSLVGTTGLVFDGSSDGVSGLSTNTDEVQYIAVKISGRSAGTVSVKIAACNNA